VSTVDIIVPVYDGIEEVRACLDSLLAAPQAAALDIVVINDASPREAITAYARELADSGRIILLENEANLGFVQTVNRGMRRSPDRDVVLLNSDTVVHGDWLDRLQAAALSAPDIATVTPFSNNAEICSFPRLCQDTRMALPASVIDHALAHGMAGQRVEIPTGVGFCMYIRRECLAQVGEFDADKFGRGYGEENDFCLRARARGWRHLLAADCFVEHVGGVSFSADKQALIENAMELLDRDYPRYHAEIAEFIQADPPYALRCKGMIECLRADARPRVLAITHHMGGGTEKHIRELEDAADAGAALIVLRPYLDSVLRLTLAVADDFPGLNFDAASERDRGALLDLLRYIGVSRVHIHHLLGTEEITRDLLTQLDLPYDFTLHDYYMIDGNPTLTDVTGLYRARREQRGEGCNSARIVEDGDQLADWQARHQRLFDGADRVFVPSAAALDIYRAHYRLENAFVTGHADLLGVTSLAVTPPEMSAGEAMKVLVLGALGLEKGADLLEAVAVRAARDGAGLSFVLLGYAYRPLDMTVQVLGAYPDGDLDRLIAQESPQLIWFPCRWPETYSYTLSAALRSGLPLVVPGIGSFPERVSGRPLTWVVDYDSAPEDCLERLQEVRSDLLNTSPGAIDWTPPRLGEFRYDRDYGVPGIAMESSVVDFSLQRVLTHLAGSEVKQAEGRRLRLLRWLLWLKRHPALAWLARLVPYRIQRRIKRRLSRRPLHDIAP
jgi:GT2 family glycosyltransferase/glycosyltransferase involved in cell wall biosynthesis